MLSMKTTYEMSISAREEPSNSARARRMGEVVASALRPGRLAGGRLRYCRAWAPVGRPQAICLMIPESGSVIIGLEWQ